jgi:hypothetical protein
LKKDVLAIVFCGISIVACLSGCQESQIEAGKFRGITLESDVVELVNASLDINYDEGEIKNVEVKYLFHNILDRTINTLKITAEFYDKNDNLITIGGPKFINNLPANYVESAGYSPANIITLTEKEKVRFVDHVVIKAIEE